MYGQLPVECEEQRHNKQHEVDQEGPVYGVEAYETIDRFPILQQDQQEKHCNYR